jgi:hypothetical protein
MSNRQLRRLAIAGWPWRKATAGGYLPPLNFLSKWGISDPVLREAVGKRLTDFPLACQTQPVVYDPAPLSALHKIYVRHTAPPMVSLRRFWEGPAIILIARNGA